jgi:hypothetical protein
MSRPASHERPSAFRRRHSRLDRLRPPQICRGALAVGPRTPRRARGNREAASGTFPGTASGARAELAAAKTTSALTAGLGYAAERSPLPGSPPRHLFRPGRPVQPVYLRPHRHPRSRRCSSKAGTAAGQALHGYTLEFPTELVPLARPRRGRALGRAVLAAFAFIVVSREQIRAAGAPDPYRRHRHTPGLDAIGTALAAPEPCPD